MNPSINTPPVQETFTTALLTSKIATAIFIAILSLGFFVKQIHLDTPDNFYFDEIYHGFTATVYLHGDKQAYDPWATPPKDRAFEWTHPPLSKLIMAGMMAVFGENAYGWRIGSAIFGSLATIASAYLAYEVFGSISIALTAMGLISLEGLFLTQSRIAMNDVYLVFFILLTMISYLRWRKSPENFKYLYFTGSGLGFALATKWTALYLYFIISIDFAVYIISHTTLGIRLSEAIRKILWKLITKLDSLNELPLYPFKLPRIATPIFNKLTPVDLALNFARALALIPLLIYIASYSQYFYMGYSFDQFIELQKQMWWYHTGLKETHPYQSVPWQWLFDLRPVYMYIGTPNPGQTANIFNIGNAVILYCGLIAVLWNIWKIVSTKPTASHYKISIILLSYFMFWVPWIFSPRMMLFYHYLPAVPFLCILLAAWLTMLREHQNPRARYLGNFIIACSIVWFILFFPQNTGLAIKTGSMDSLYYALPGWR